MDICEFCGRSNCAGMHWHHITPKCKGGKETVMTCGNCGSFIHSTWSHNQLKYDFNSVEKIQQDPKFKSYLKWIKKQPSSTKFKTLRRKERPKHKYS